MSKKFDVVIGNPPYQSEPARPGGRGEPLYHLFMDAAYELGRQAVIITPARFLSNAGQTPKAWNEKMLADEHLEVAFFEPDSGKLFPQVTDTIKGGIVVTRRDSEQVLGPIGTFFRHPALKTALDKVAIVGEPSLMAIMSSGVPYSYTAKMHEEHPEAAPLIGSPNDKSSIRTAAFSELPFIFHAAQPVDGHGYVQVYGLADSKRTSRYVRRDYISGEHSIDTWKIAVPKANGTGSTTDFFGIALTNPEILAPGVGVTQTFVTVGSFTSEFEAAACLKYLKSKFARAMLGILKVTQDNPRGTWRHVPLQNFTASSDIDWSKSVPEIDRQLYGKYGLDVEEIEFIETHVKPMS